jgi:hypothetical protein
VLASEFRTLLKLQYNMFGFSAIFFAVFYNAVIRKRNYV